MNSAAARQKDTAIPPQDASRFPLTSLQRSMILASMRAPRSGAYVVQGIYEFAEELDPALLRRAWRTVVRRHEALRTCFETAGPHGLVQRILDDYRHEWRDLDWTSVPPGERTAKLEEFLELDAHQGFDLSGGPPLRFTLLRHAEQSYTLVMTRHHAMYDGRSFFTIRREWFPLYDAYRRGEELQLPAAHSFREHLQRLEGRDWTASQQYWREALSGVERTTDFVVDRVRTAERFPRQGVEKEGLKLTPEQTHKIAAFANDSGVTLNTLVQAAWALLLFRYSGRREVVFGVTRSCRRSLPPEAVNTIGLIVNTPPFRIDVPRGESVLPWLREFGRRWNLLREHEHTPLDKIAEWGGLPAGSPPFDTVVLYDHGTVGDVAFKPGENSSTRKFSWRQGTDAALTLAAYGAPVLALDITYDPNRFSRRTVAAMLGHLETLLLEFAERPGARLADLNLLTAEERSWLLVQRNATAAEFPQTRCAHRLFELQAARTPEQTAIEHRSGSLSYRELNERANRLAALLREKRIHSGHLVAVCLHRTPEAVVSLLAILKAGAAFLPLHPTLPPERIAAMLQDSGAKLVISAHPLAAKLDGCECEVLWLDRLSAEIDSQAVGNLPDFADSASLAYAIYTSGSTGQPKAAAISHRSLVNHTLAAARAFGISESDRRLGFAAPGADVFVAEVFNYLCQGATLVYCLGDEGNSMHEFLRLLEEQRISITGLPSTWWREWVARLDSGRAALPSPLRAVIAGMERVEPADFLKWRRAAAGRVRWFNAYGPAEATPTATVYEAGSSVFESSSFVPIGKPIANTKVYVLDGEGNPVPAGVPGELYLGGEGVGEGYLGRPALTAQRFIPNPFEPGANNRLYRTGDIVFTLPDGNLVYLCRQDRQIKIRGFRVELDEIEAVLARHESVDQCAVVPAGDSGREILVAYLSPTDPSAAPTPGQLRAHLSRHLPEQMVPSGYVVLARLPRTASGKIDRTALPPYDRDAQQPAPQLQPPSSATEKKLSSIWREILAIARIDTGSNFFELGGDSLLATRLITAIDEHFGKEIPLAELLRAPTLSQLAAVIDDGFPSVTASGDVHLIPLQSNGAKVPFFCIAATPAAPYAFRHLAVRLGDDQPFFAIPNPLRAGERPQTVEELAGRMAYAIREARPNGPYALGGYCFGGVIAAETARQLAASGGEVRVVALFDTPAPGYPKFWRGGVRYIKELRHLIAQRANERGQLAAHAKVLYRLLWRKATGTAQRGLLRSKMRFAVRPHDDFLKLSERSSRMYIPKPIPCPVVQFIAKGDRVSARVLEDPRLGWRDVAPLGFELCEVPGTHGGILEAQSSSDLAGPLASILNRNSSVAKSPRDSLSGEN